MNKILFKNIATLLQVTPQTSAIRGEAMSELPAISNAYLLLENRKIAAYGEMQYCPVLDNATTIVDATDRLVLPCWCDSHTHLVFAKTRESEFEDRLHGLTYEQIALRGGGILNSARALQQTPEAVLLEQAFIRLQSVMHTGTGAIEIKSGYGLTVDSELKMLRVIQQLKQISPIPIKATFLGAHTVPMECRPDNRHLYIQLIIDKMLPTIADQGLADYIDVFCEKVAFTAAETERIIEAGLRFGLKPKIHTNQFYSMGGIEASLRHRAISVDHLEVVNDEEIELLKYSNTIATLLPSAPFFLNDHYPPARRLLDNGVTIALASDYNPGTSPSGSMPFVLSLACIKMKMSPTEAINALTLNGAAAMELADTHGSIAVGKNANIIITKPVPSVAYLPYSFTENWVEQVWIDGKKI